jgi:hypothetical protein
MVGMVIAFWVQRMVPFVHTRPLEEYRNPASRPDVVEIITRGNGRIAPAVNAWFDDLVSFRSFLTRLANQIDYSIFRYSNKVLIGQNGWLFDRGFFRDEIALSRIGDDLKIEKEQLIAISKFLDRKGIRLVVISTPAKETIYRDLLPPGSPMGPIVSEFEKFRTDLKAGDGRYWTYIDSAEILTRAKDNGQNLYFRTDIHATTYGTMLVARELINRLAQAEHADWRWNPVMHFRAEVMEVGFELRAFPLLSRRAEEIEELEWGARYNPAAPPSGEVFEKLPAEPFEIIFHNETKRPTLPRTVLFGSSFLDRYLLIGAYSFFKDVYRARGTSDSIGATLRAIPPGTQYFVYEFWEPHLVLIRQAQIPQED